MVNLNKFKKDYAFKIELKKNGKEFDEVFITNNKKRSFESRFIK